MAIFPFSQFLQKLGPFDFCDKQPCKLTENTSYKTNFSRLFASVHQKVEIRHVIRSRTQKVLFSLYLKGQFLPILHIAASLLCRTALCQRISRSENPKV